MAIVQKMIKPYRNLKTKVLVACSGGADSMALLHFMRVKDKNVEALFVHHLTDECSEALSLLAAYCHDNGIILHIRHITNIYESNKEHFWHIERYRIFHSFKDYTVFTGHTLDDQVENFLMHSIKGLAKLIPYCNQNVIRPMLYIRKSELIEYCNYYNVSFYNDPDNFNESNSRAIVRNQIVPIALKVNPGLYSTVEKLVRESSYVWQKELGI